MRYYTEFTPPAGVSPLCNTPEASRTDLLLHVPLYGVESDAPISEMFRTAHFNTPDNAYRLTDGVTHSELDFHDPAFTHFTGGTGRRIFYRLPYLSAADGFSVDFLCQIEAGIKLPYRFDLYLSEDGVSWQRVYSKRRFETFADTRMYRLESAFDRPYRASWVRLDMDVPAHMWLERVSLYGNTAHTDTAETPIEDGARAERDSLTVNRYPTYDELCGTHNIFLAYNCMPPEYDQNGVGSFGTEDLLPYVGYIADGKIKDTFFDGALFLPFSRFTYSKLYKCAEGWRYYIDNTFAEGKNVDALDSAAEQVGKALGTDCKVNVFLSIFHTKPGYGEFPEKFGDLDGDGTDEDLTTFEGRKKATQWMIDTQLARYAEKQRRHLKLTGFYWFEEEISYNDPMELDLLAFARDYVHAKGYKLIWIPYYQAWGYDEWKKNGFDVACIQPNYAFSKDALPERLYDNAAIAKKYGLCYEIEVGGIRDPFDVHKYKDYLEAGIKTGFMHTIKMYYQGGRDFLAAYRSDNKLTRSVYDDTYLFAKEHLETPYREDR